MSRTLRNALAGAFAALMLVVALLTLRPQAMDIGFTSVNGEHVELAQLRGHPVILTFWASDCRTCLLEIPEFGRLHRDYAGHGVRVFGVAMGYDLPSRVVSLIREADVGYEVVLDVDGRLAAAFGNVRLVPATFLLGVDGRIRQSTLGPVNFTQLRKQIETVLRES